MMKFGKDISMRDEGSNEMVVHVTVTNNDGFYQWLASCGTNVILESPENMREQFVRYVQRILDSYKG